MFHTSIFAGYVGKDAEQRFNPSGKAVTSFSVAVNEKFKDASGEQVERTTWYNVQAWGKLAETCGQYVKKGMLVLVEGRPVVDPATGSPRIWTSQDGTPRTSLEISAQTVRFLTRVSDVSGAPDSDRMPPDDECPF